MPDALPNAQPTVSNHWSQWEIIINHQLLPVIKSSFAIVCRSWRAAQSCAPCATRVLQANTNNFRITHPVNLWRKSTQNHYNWWNGTESDLLPRCHRFKVEMEKLIRIDSHHRIKWIIFNLKKTTWQSQFSFLFHFHFCSFVCTLMVLSKMTRHTRSYKMHNTVQNWYNNC